MKKERNWKIIPVEGFPDPMIVTTLVDGSLHIYPTDCTMPEWVWAVKAADQVVLKALMDARIVYEVERPVRDDA